jgi:dienelactone hydrolase
MDRKKASDFSQELLDLFHLYVHGEIGANHGSHNDTTPRYDEAVAKLARQRTLTWFDTYLRG